MSFSDIQNLLRGRKPAWLYDFDIGGIRTFLHSHNEILKTPYDVYDLANVYAADDMYWRTWVPSPVKHGRIPFTTKPGKSSLQLTFPISDIFARQFLSPGGVFSTRLTIYKYHRNDPQFEQVVKYRGELIQVKPGETDIILEFGSDSIQMDTQALVATMSRGCTHAHYFGGCGLELSDWQIAAVATAGAGDALTVPVAGLLPDNTYRAGMLQWGDYKEMIKSHSGNILTLLRPIPGLAEDIATNGDADIKIAPGCDLTIETCGGVFDNNLNYPGYPWMTTSPFTGQSIV